jgi:uncharacterized membrane protein YhaH (DUF805 family)
MLYTIYVLGLILVLTSNRFIILTESAREHILYIASTMPRNSAAFRPYLKTSMDIIRTIWIINFFFFLLVLIFLWSKLYLISRRMSDLLSILKKNEQLPGIASKETGQPRKA